ncbi:GTP-binding protein engB [Syntrophobotulus glycolicus DSM 8271]|uniref:Probable GTP-binding protein EngB n=1 Tax=Syntrophobotulus glycolicus (strain DSM 8271 / FlGlyR) TaxID=645991 RepID=F0SVY7_SYNGF|nr:ribosome biogenesis GTP-binding protein YihA/YsxC [Syntrophobotulus glycolicus]ADY56771.1 GTP-binding protein engB [Syntrophobotulus glycolicus DSM 8271]
MIIRKVEYIISAVKPEQYPPGVSMELAVAGRSNVGKSSLINKFLNRKNMARVGQTPGKTQAINFFHINDEWYLVDLPGYGYAKVSLEVKARWGRMMQTYFQKRGNLLGVIQLVDIRHKPTEDDKTMVKMLRDRGIPMLLVATKADKLSRSRQIVQLKIIAETLGVEDWKQIIPFSAVDGTGNRELHEEVDQLLQNAAEAVMPSEAGTPAEHDDKKEK